jgi:PhnB protein
MTSRLCPYLAFDGNAREAMEFYCSVFGGTLNVTTFGEFGGGGAEVPADGVMHARLETDRDFVLMASDTPGRMDVQIGTAITISLSGDDGDDLRGYWAALTDGGQVQMVLEKQVWGDEFGMCTDRFGIPWMVNIAQPQG